MQRTNDVYSEDGELLDGYGDEGPLISENTNAGRNVDKGGASSQQYSKELIPFSEGKLKGGNINQKDQNGRTPLFRLIKLLQSWHGDRQQYIDTLRSLISRGASVNCVGGSDMLWRDETPLWLLVGYRYSEELSDMKMEVARILLEAGADINARLNNSRSSLLASAVEQRDIEFAQLLIEHGADPNEVIGGKTISEIIDNRGEEIRKAKKLIDEAFDLLQNGHYSTASRVLREAAQYRTSDLQRLFSRIESDYNQGCSYAVNFINRNKPSSKTDKVDLSTGLRFAVMNYLLHG